MLWTTTQRSRPQDWKHLSSSVVWQDCRLHVFLGRLKLLHSGWHTIHCNINGCIITRSWKTQTVYIQSLAEPNTILTKKTLGLKQAQYRVYRIKPKDKQQNRVGWRRVVLTRFLAHCFVGVITVFSASIRTGQQSHKSRALSSCYSS